MATYQPELLFQTSLNFRGYGPVSTGRCLGAEASQVTVGGVAGGYYGLWKLVAQVRGQVELALLGDLQGIG